MARELQEVVVISAHVDNAGVPKTPPRCTQLFVFYRHNHEDKSKRLGSTSIPGAGDMEVCVTEYHEYHLRTQSSCTHQVNLKVYIRRTNYEIYNVDWIY